MRFILQKSEHPGKWVCTDTINKIVCVFEERKFNETQEFTALENTNLGAGELAKYVREMGDWLVKNHPEKI